MAIKPALVFIGVITALLIAVFALGYPPSGAKADVDASGANLLEWGREAWA